MPRVETMYVVQRCSSYQKSWLTGTQSILDDPCLQRISVAAAVNPASLTTSRRTFHLLHIQAGTRDMRPDESLILPKGHDDWSEFEDATIHYRTEFANAWLTVRTR